MIRDPRPERDHMPRRLTRNRRDAVISGVAAGFADYFGVDPVLVQVTRLG